MDAVGHFNELVGKLIRLVGSMHAIGQLIRPARQLIGQFAKKLTIG